MFHLDVFARYLTSGYLLVGVLVTIALTALPMHFGLPLALGLALARRSGSGILSGFARFYVWIFRASCSGIAASR
jgi:polar amino acid transport system permease protein